MKIDGLVVSKTVPAWANGRVATVDGKMVLLLSEKPTLLYPRWWHTLGLRLGWRWLQRFPDGD